MLATHEIIDFTIVKTNRRLTFDILHQHPLCRWTGADDGNYPIFIASNNYQVISQSRMDIQTGRLWLLGVKGNERSGSMVFSDNEKRDRAYDEFHLALREWIAYVRPRVEAGIGFNEIASHTWRENDPHANLAARLFGINLCDVTSEQRQVAKKARYMMMWDALPADYKKALEADLNNKDAIISEVHGWAVCAAIAPPGDLFQNINRIVDITQPGAVIVDE